MKPINQYNTITLTATDYFEFIKTFLDILREVECLNRTLGKYLTTIR